MKGIVGQATLLSGQKSSSPYNISKSTLRFAGHLLRIPDKIPTDVLEICEYVRLNPASSNYYKRVIYKFWMTAAENGWLHGVVNQRPILKLETNLNGS